MTVEAMLSRIGNVVAHAGQPLEWVQGLEVTAERGVHPGAVQHSLPAVEVDELPEREGISDEVSSSVLESPTVVRRDWLADVRREARVAPGQQLGGAAGTRTLVFRDAQHEYTVTEK
jgi:hypothetical protein